MISKELLSEVLELTSGNVFIKEIETKNNDIEYLCNVGGWSLLNIHELANKCKEWAIKQDKIDLITLEIDKNEKKISCSILYGEVHPNMKMYYFNADTEVEAVFRACEWILDKKPLF